MCVGGTSAHPAAVDDAGKLGVVHPARQGHAAQAAIVGGQEQGIEVAAGEGEEGERSGQAGLLQAQAESCKRNQFLEKGKLGAGARHSIQRIACSAQWQAHIDGARSRALAGRRVSVVLPQVRSWRQSCLPASHI